MEERSRGCVARCSVCVCIMSQELANSAFLFIGGIWGRDFVVNRHGEDTKYEMLESGVGYDESGLNTMRSAGTGRDDSLFKTAIEICTPVLQSCSLFLRQFFACNGSSLSLAFHRY